MIQENLRTATILLQEERANGVPVVAICALSRAAAILVRLCGSELSSQDLVLLRSLLHYVSMTSDPLFYPFVWFLSTSIYISASRSALYVSKMLC